jgi:hypothetical protein
MRSELLFNLLVLNYLSFIANVGVFTSLRELTAPQEDALITYLDVSRPSLKTDVKNLSSLLSGLIEDQFLPSRTLMLEVLSESQIRSGELAVKSLKELLEYSDDVNYTSYLTDEALSKLSGPSSAVSPLCPVDLENTDSSGLGSPVADIGDNHNLGIALNIDYLNLPSPIDRDMDQFGEEFFYSQS